MWPYREMHMSDEVVPNNIQWQIDSTAYREHPGSGSEREASHSCDEDHSDTDSDSSDSSSDSTHNHKECKNSIPIQCKSNSSSTEVHQEAS